VSSKQHYSHFLVYVDVLTFISIAIWLHRKDQFLRHPSLYSANESGEHARSIRGKNKHLSGPSNFSRADSEEQGHHKGKGKGREKEHRQSGAATATIPWTKYVPTHPPPPIVTVTDWSSLPPGIESVPTPPKPPRPPSVFIPALVVTPCSTPSTSGEDDDSDSALIAVTAFASGSGIDSASSGAVFWGSSLQEKTSFSKYDRTSPLDRIVTDSAVNMDCVDAYRTKHLSPDSATTYHSTFRTSESKTTYTGVQNHQQHSPASSSNRNNLFLGSGTSSKEQKHDRNKWQNNIQRRVSFVLPETYKGVRLLPIEPITPPGIIAASTKLVMDSLAEATLRDYYKCDPTTISPTDFQVINVGDTPPPAYTTSTPSKHRGVFGTNSPLSTSMPSELHRRDELEVMSAKGDAEIDLSDVHVRQEGLSMIEEIDEDDYLVGAMDVTNSGMRTVSHNLEESNTRRNVGILPDQEDQFDLVPYPDVFDLNMYFCRDEEDEDISVPDSWKQFDEIKLKREDDMDNRDESFLQTLYCDIVFNTSDTPFSAKRFGFISTQPPPRFPVLASHLSQAPDTPSPDLNTDTPSFMPDTPSPLPPLPVDTIRPNTAGVPTVSERTQRYRDQYRHPAYSCPAHLSGSSQDKDNSSSSAQSVAWTSTTSENQVASSSSTGRVLATAPSSKRNVPALPVTARISQSKSDSKKKVSVKVQSPKSILGLSHKHNVQTHTGNMKRKGGKRKEKENQKRGSHELAPTPTEISRTRATRPLPPPIVIVSHHSVDSMPTNESYSRRLAQAPSGHSDQQISDEGSPSQEALRARLKETCENFSKSVWTEDSYTLEAISFVQD